MARPRGSRSAEYTARRDELLKRVAAFLVAAYPLRPSFREIAAACEVSQPTLRHYFGNRDGLIAAHLARYGDSGAPFLGHLSVTDLPIAASLKEMAHFVLDGFTLPVVGTAQAVALSEGLASAGVGPDYLGHVLEPALQAVAARLRLHIARGEMQDCNTRHVAAIFVAPLFVASLHQHYLGGRACYPLDLPGLADDAAQAVLRAYGTALLEDGATPE